MIQDVDKFVAIVRDACEHGHNWEPEHPQYIEGRLYLTPEQWAAIRREWPHQAGHNTAQAVWGIPVDIIQPDKPVQLPSGKWLVHSTVMESFYVFSNAIARDAGLT